MINIFRNHFVISCRSNSSVFDTLSNFVVLFFFKINKEKFLVLELIDYCV